MARRKQNRNVTAYKGLKARKARVGEVNAMRKQGIQNTKEFLAKEEVRKPAQNVAPQQNTKELENMQKDYDKKINNLRKEYTDQLTNIERSNKLANKNLTGALKDTRAENNSFRESVSGAFDRMAKNNQAAAKNAQSEDKEEDKKEEEAQEEYVPGKDDYITIPSLSYDTNAEEKNSTEDRDAEVSNTDTDTNTESAAVKTSKNIALKVSQEIKVGNLNVRITNLYGPRSGKNAVMGRKSGEHSRGVDFTTYDAAGNKVNYPVSMTDGEIIGIHLQGNGKSISTLEGKAAGYYMDVRLASNPNKIIRYAHLDPGIMTNKDSLIGKKVKRGDILFEGNEFTGSGTGSHIKIFMTDIDRSGKILSNYTAPGNDPSNLILNGV